VKCTLPRKKLEFLPNKVTTGESSYCSLRRIEFSAKLLSSNLLNYRRKGRVWACDSTVGTEVPFSFRCAHSIIRSKQELAAIVPRQRPRKARAMRKTILAGAIFLFIGTSAAFAQHPAAMKPSSNTFGGGGVSGGGISAASGGVRSTPAPAPAANVGARNDGRFVPSTYANYLDAVAQGDKALNNRPASLGDLSRQVREQKKATGDKARVFVDQDEHGKLRYSPREP
jgi:hypothetical protein